MSALIENPLENIYNVDFSVQYGSNQEYRKCLRHLFFMQCDTATKSDDIDEETQDELLYDEKTISGAMDVLFELTKNNVLFQRLYDIGASKMFSTDQSIGQAVLMSYDYLELYHKCLGCFMQNTECFTESNLHFIALIQKIS